MKMLWLLFKLICNCNIDSVNIKTIVTMFVNSLAQLCRTQYAILLNKLYAGVY